MTDLVKSIVKVTLLACVSAGVAAAQLTNTAAAGPQSTLEAELRLMAAQAGVIFAGQVVGIHAASTTTSGAVEITFRVDQAIRGCAPGSYVLREWAGLWVGGVERYHVGDRLLMLLHAPGASGLSTPVGHQDGAIPITGGGSAPGAADLFTTAGGQVVDLRWIEARLLRSPSNVQAGAVAARVSLPSSPAESHSFHVNAGAVTEASLRGITTGMSLQGVLALLAAWEAQTADAR